MTEQLERDMKRVIERFIAEILAMAHHAAIEAVHSGFAASHGGGRHSQSARHGTGSILDSPALSARITDFVHEHPGWSTAQISESLQVHTGVARRHLRQLADQGVIRIKEVPVGGLTRRTYFGPGQADERTTTDTVRAEISEAVA